MIKDRSEDADIVVMDGTNENNIGDTIRIRRPPRVFTDEHGRTVWMSDVEPAELEIELDSVTNTNPYDLRLSV